LGALFRESEPAALIEEGNGHPVAGVIGAVVFGSDQGLVGQFNEAVADFAIQTLAALPGRPRSGPSVSGFMRVFWKQAFR
jgi:F-type H+-transporting ATPase subunit gamma